MSMNAEIDVRPVLESVRVPTLVLHRTGDRVIAVGAGRYLAEHIPGSTFVEMPVRTTCHGSATPERVVGEIEEFLTGTRHEPEGDRVLATVLFTDIVESTQRASALGDQAWGTSCRPTMRSCASSSDASAGVRWRRRVMASSPRSTGRLAPFGARSRS